MRVESEPSFFLKGLPGLRTSSGAWEGSRRFLERKGTILFSGGLDDKHPLQP